MAEHAKLAIDDLWERIFPKNNPFFEKDGKKWARFDSMSIELKDDHIVVNFEFEGQAIYYMQLPAKTGDIAIIKDIHGISEVVFGRA